MQAGGLGSWRESLCWRRGAGSQVWQALQQAVPQRAAAGRGELLPDQPGLSKCSCCLYSRGESQNRQSPSVGKGRWRRRSGRVAWERGFPPTRSSSASQNCPVTLALSQLLFGFSAFCVYMNPAVFFRCARLRQRELSCASCWVVGSGL